MKIHSLFSGGTPEGHILAGYYGFNENMSFTFQAIKHFSDNPTYSRFGLFYKFVGDCWVYFGEK